jgi:hypothetical protein
MSGSCETDPMDGHVVEVMMPHPLKITKGGAFSTEVGVEKASLPSYQLAVTTVRYRSTSHTLGW